MLAVRTGLRLVLRRPMPPSEWLSFAFIAYALLVALGIAYARVRVAGAEYALSPRYANYSIYTLFGLALAAVARPRRPEGQVREADPASLVMILAILGVAWYFGLRFAAGCDLQARYVESAMVPYSLDYANLSPARPESTAWCCESAQAVRGEFLAGGKTLFGSSQYRLYRAALENPAALPEAICRASARVMERTEVAGGTLLDLEFRFDSGIPKDSAILLLTDARGRAVGWAPVRARTGQWFPGLLSHEARELARGFAILPRGDQSLLAVPLDRQGRALCRSEAVGSLVSADKPKIPRRAETE
jgi:hypothetical protein